MTGVIKADAGQGRTCIRDWVGAGGEQQRPGTTNIPPYMAKGL